MGRTSMSDIRLEPGDTILIGGTDRAFEELRESHDLLVLEWSAEAVPQRRKAGIAIAIFAAIVLTAALDLLPIVVTSIAGAFAMILAGCLTLQQAGRAFDRQIFLLVGSSIAAATALERTGGAQLIADSAVNLMQGQSPAVFASGYFLVVAVMTNFLSNNATAVLFTPIGLGIAKPSAHRWNCSWRQPYLPRMLHLRRPSATRPTCWSWVPVITLSGISLRRVHPLL